jgi:hypothetical protein
MEKKNENCLEYALRFWRENPEYRIYYNGDHVVNVRTDRVSTYVPIEESGYEAISRSFAGLLSAEGEELLSMYYGLTQAEA